jgi:hypothetical protein
MHRHPLETGRRIPKACRISSNAPPAIFGQALWRVLTSKKLRSKHFRSTASRNRPTPFSKRTHPDITVVLSTDLVPAKIEQIGYNSVGNQNSLSLTWRVSTEFRSSVLKSCYPSSTYRQPDRYYQQPSSAYARSQSPCPTPSRNRVSFLQLTGQSGHTPSDSIIGRSNHQGVGRTFPMNFIALCKKRASDYSTRGYGPL